MESQGSSSTLPRTGVDPNGAHARQTAVYRWWLGEAPAISCHLTCHYLAWSGSAGSCAKETRRPMKKASYREPDYAFGQRMLRLRMSIGLTQVGLAKFLGVSRN